MGVHVKDILLIPRTSLREGNNIWLLDADNKLRITPIEPLWTTTDAVYIENIFDNGVRLITSSLSAPVEGMSLSLEGERPAGNGPEGR